MLNFDFLGTVWEYHLHHILCKKKEFSCSITDQLSLPDCLSFLRYWSICVLLHEFWNQLCLSNQAVFRHDQKLKKKNLNIMRTYLRWKTFFIIFKGFSVSKNILRLESAPLMLCNSTSWSRLKLTVQIQLSFNK